MILTIDISTRGERRVLSERIDNIVIDSIRVMVGLLGVVVILIKELDSFCERVKGHSPWSRLNIAS